MRKSLRIFELPVLTDATEGFVEERRALVVGVPAVMAAALASPGRLHAAMDDAGSDRELQAFLDSSLADALALKADASYQGQQAYIEHIDRAVGAIRDVSANPLSDVSWKGFDPGVFLGVSGRNAAFFVVQWRLAPNAFLPPHCHPKTSVCTLTLEGAATVTHFEAPDDVPSYRTDRSTEFLVRKTREVPLKPGVTSTLTEYRDNIHLFEAGNEGARGIDVTTDYGGDGSFSFLDIERSEPADRSGGHYRARWIGTDI